MNTPSSKRFLFWIATLIVPVVFLLACETVLTIIDYGGNLDLVTTKDVLGTSYYTLNPGVSRRYFSQENIAIPEPHDDIFEIHKRPTTKRIFMLGESTMAGFPYDYNATAPQLLHDRLQQVLPQYSFEVINCGLSAVNSYTVDDFIDELVDYKPDAFVVYLGHNEFYGALGVGSTEYLGKSPSLIHLYLSFTKHLRLFRLVRDGVMKLRRLVHPDVTPAQSTLMEAMARSQAILYGSEEYELAKKNFYHNLEDIIGKATSRHVPILFSTLTSNVRDQQPLLAAFSPQTDERKKAEWKRIYSEGSSAFEIGNFNDAVVKFREAVHIDSANADGHFFLAKSLDTLGQFDLAKKEYEDARDNDGLRFRASGDFNNLLRMVCSAEHVPLSNTDKAFQQASPHHLVGNNLMLEHVHPNFDGYRLLAESIFQTLYDNDVIAPKSEYHSERNLSEAGYKELAGVTPFEEEVAHYRIFQLKNSWPFRSHDSVKVPYVPRDYLQQLVIKYVGKEIPWSQAHYDIAQWYKQRGQYDSARAEYFAVSKVIPYSYYPFMMMGDMERLMNRNDSAEELYRKALTTQESPFVHVRLGMMYFELNKIDRAIKEFESTLQHEASDSLVMNSKDRSLTRFFLGAAYGRQGDLPRAKMYLQLALQIDPQNIEAKAMLSKIP